MTAPKLFDSIALLQDLPDDDLLRGNVGAVVEVFGDGEAYEVEFVDTNGETYGLTTLLPTQFVVLSHESARERIAA